MNAVLNHREWLIQPDALQSMAASLRGLVDKGGMLPKQASDSPLLSIEDGIPVVAKLRDLNGIARSMETRLHAGGIHTVPELCAASKPVLHRVWGGAVTKCQLVVQHLKCGQATVNVSDGKLAHALLWGLL